MLHKELNKRGTTISRRKFIQYSGILGGGLVIGLGTKGCDPAMPDPAIPVPERLNGFSGGDAVPVGEYIQIRSDGQIFFNMVRLEMGQGAVQGIMAIFAEELGADWSKINVIYSDPIPGKENWTGGSTTTMREWETMRHAGALIRTLLVETAATLWKVPQSTCRVENGIIRRSGTNQQMTFGELAEKVVFRSIPIDELKLKDPQDFKLIGTSFENPLIPDMILGRHPFGMDLRLPDMKFASIERAPGIDDTLIVYDPDHALQVAGVEQVVAIPGAVVDGNTHVRPGIAVIATNNWAAMEGRKRLKVEWKKGPKSHISHETHLKHAYQRLDDERGNVIFSSGKEHSTSSNVQEISHTYEFPYQHHACMEVLNATAKFGDETCEVWVGTQASERAQNQLANYFDLPKERVSVHCHPAGGGFGLRYWAAPELEAAMVSKASGGELVQVLYTREDDIQFDYLNPLEINRHTVSVEGGKMTSWHMHTAIDAWGGTCYWMIYDIPRLLASEIRLEGFTQMSAWRAVMGNAEGFSTECFVDEVATTLNEDPIAFRLKHLTRDKEVQINHQFKININRILATLELAKEKAHWGKELPPGHGQGVAVYPYMHGNGYATAIAEVAVHGNQVEIISITIAVDCGLVINPDFVKKQMEGGAIWAISAIFFGGTEYAGGRVTRSNFHDNQVLRISQTPTFDIHICESQESNPWGVGEIAPPVTYPAVCNAIYAATGKRIRKLPISPEFQLS